MVYTPNKWLLLRISHASKESVIRVMASWSGGWDASDEWKLSSRVTAITKLDDDLIDFATQSGSMYHVLAHAQGLSPYAQEVLASMEKDSPALTFERLTLDEAAAEIGSVA